MCRIKPGLVLPAVYRKVIFVSMNDGTILVSGMSGFTGSGYPKVVPAAFARRIEKANSAGEKFRIGV